MNKPALSIIFGPKKPGEEMPMKGEPRDEIPPEFADHADAAFDAYKKGDREAWASALFDAIHAALASETEEEATEESDEELPDDSEEE